MNIDLAYKEIQTLQHAGRLQEAKLAGIALLRAHPHDSKVLHLVGMIHAELGELDEAKFYLEQAKKFQPEHVAIAMHLASVLKGKELYQEAEQLFQDILSAHPDFAAAYNNLGTLYFAQARWHEAIVAFQKTIELQVDYLDAYYNLGLSFNKLSQKDKAMREFKALLELNPQHVGARFQLASLLVERDQAREAIKHFNMLLAEYPFHFESLSNIAAAYLKLDFLNDAKSYYLKALDIMPEDTQIIFNLGVIATKQGRLQEAVDYYLQALKLKPDWFDAHNNLGVVYLTLRDRQAALLHLREAALLHFREASRLQPNNEAVRHTVNILTGDQSLTASPPDYIRTLFDSYADHYDAHLVQSLQYRVPQQLYQLVMKHTDTNTKKNVLDLGCGTGLCGEVFKSISCKLIGVDLSEKMLAIAKAKQIYDEVVEADLVEYLKQHPHEYDLIVAGDVLIYFGDLAAMCSAVSEVLQPNGYFVFNAEIHESKDYEMTDSGRFKHSKQYIDKMLLASKLNIVAYQAAPIRTNSDLPVMGHLYLVRK